MNKIIKIRDEEYQRIYSGGIEILVPVEQVDRFLEKEKHYTRLQKLADHVKRFVVDYSLSSGGLSYDYRTTDKVDELDYILEELYKLGE